MPISLFLLLIGGSLCVLPRAVRSQVSNRSGGGIFVDDDLQSVIILSEDYDELVANQSLPSTSTTTPTSPPTTTIKTEIQRSKSYSVTQSLVVASLPSRVRVRDQMWQASPRKKEISSSRNVDKVFFGRPEDETTEPLTDETLGTTTALKEAVTTSPAALPQSDEEDNFIPENSEFTNAVDEKPMSFRRPANTRQSRQDSIFGSSRETDSARTRTSPIVSGRRPTVTVTRSSQVINTKQLDNGMAGDIRCMEMSSREAFAATLRLPPGFSATPLLEDSPTQRSSGKCSVAALAGSRSPGAYRLRITDLDSCGVKHCKHSDGQNWLCVTVRFPVVAGLRLPEDEVIIVKCRPQDRSIARLKSLDFFSTEVEKRSPPLVYSGGIQEFECEIGLFRKLPGTVLFSSRVLPGNDIQLGEEVQLRSIVRSGDGWLHSKLTDVTVRRVLNSGDSSPAESVKLVNSDGCVNRRYSLVAPGHPGKDRVNNLINEFSFRVFMFQNMKSGESIQVSARVVACVEEIDCAPSLCEDSGQGHGRRRRRRSASPPTPTLDTEHGEKQHQNETFEVTRIVVPESLLTNRSANSTTGWQTGIAVRVIDPLSRSITMSRYQEDPTELQLHCRFYLILSGTASCSLCFLVVAVAVLVTMRRGYKKPTGTARETIGDLHHGIASPPSSNKPASAVPDSALYSLLPISSSSNTMTLSSRVTGSTSYGYDTMSSQSTDPRRRQVPRHLPPTPLDHTYERPRTPSPVNGRRHRSCEARRIIYCDEDYSPGTDRCWEHRRTKTWGKATGTRLSQDDAFTAAIARSNGEPSRVPTVDLVVNGERINPTQISIRKHLPLYSNTMPPAHHPPPVPPRPRSRVFMV